MLTFIDTNKLSRQITAEGEFTEVLNRDLCGAKNVVAALAEIRREIRSRSFGQAPTPLSHGGERKHTPRRQAL